MRASALTPPSTTAAIWLARWTFSAAAVSSLFVFGLGIALAGFEAAYRDRIFPGVSSWGIDLSGMTRAAAAEALTHAFTYPQSGQITLRDGERTWVATPKELGIAFDIESTVAAAYAVGRRGDIVADLGDQFDTWYAGHPISPIVLYDYARADNYLRLIAAQIDTPTTEAGITVFNGEVSVAPAVVGRHLDVPATIHAIQSPISILSSAEVPLVVSEETPAVLDATAQGEIARKILSAPLTLTIPDPREGEPSGFTLDVPTLQSMLVFRRVEDGPNLAHYEVGLSPEALHAFLDPLAPTLAKEPANARFIYNEDTKQLELYKPSSKGRALAVDASIREINLQVTRGEHVFPLVFDVTPPTVEDNATAEGLGIADLLVSQSTYFAGSGKERVNNITVGAGQFLGVLIAPGETFSFNKYLGDVSLDTGFAEALIIYAGRTIKGVGGGICQVSTTAFRAAFYAGFPIVERHSHAYRVQWYERGFGPGLDATVFAPVADFKFKNDMNTWVLMEAYVYPGRGEIEFKLYGAPDGRKVEIGRPQISNVIPHEPDVFVEDPEVEPGKVKQVEWAADGSDVSVSRTVTSVSGEVLYEDNIRTHYLPWQAEYHVALGELPTPTP
ncbi:MAG: VanW family protein [Chloroflexi bacterium]|nr:VanW family protein [Chloroflexota bacterium]